EEAGVQGMADADDGSLLFSTKGGVSRVVDGKAQLAYPLPASLREFYAKRLLRDRDGGLWAEVAGRGIVHFHQGRADLFSQSDGLTGEAVLHLYEDREGNIWVSTVNGIDRFRELPVVTYSTNQGLSGIPKAVVAARDGSIWFETFDGLARLKDGQITLYRGRSSRTKALLEEIAVSGLPEQGLGTLFQDSHGRTWVSTLTGIGYLENDRFVSTPVPGGNVDAMTGDARGNLWIANQDLGLFRLSPGNE